MSRSAFYVLFTASGFAGLIYESIWTHYLKLFLGHAAYAQSLVLVVFMGGMAAGAAWCARFSERFANPLLAYAVVEAVIGVFALAFHLVFVAATDWSYGALLPALDNEWGVLAAKLALCCLLILPQSVLLGMTFPLMSAGLARSHPASKRIGRDALLHQQPRRAAACSPAVRAHRLVVLPATLASRGCSTCCSPCRVGFSRGRSLLSENRHAGEDPCAPPPRVAFSPCLPPSSTRSCGSACSHWCWRLDAFVRAHALDVHPRLALGGFAVRTGDRTVSPERFLGWVQLVMGCLRCYAAVYDLTFDQEA